MTRYAVPSRSRADVIEGHTLALLRRLGVSNDDIDVWVVPEQVDAYSHLGVNLRQVSDTVGLRGARNSIARGYPKGSKVIQFDDDATNAYVGWKGQELALVTPMMWDDITGFAWDQCRLLGLGLWGSYPVCNDFFMQPYATTDLRRVSGGLFGQVLRHDDTELLVCDEKEDYERTIRYYLRDNGVLRLNWLTLRVGYMTGDGGMSEYRTVESDRAGARRIHELWPKLTRYVPARGARGTGEVDLRRVGGVSSPVPIPPRVRASVDPRLTLPPAQPAELPA